MNYFDAHCHLQLSQFDADRDAVIDRMQEGGFGGIVVGTDFASSREAVELADQHEFLWAAVGLHPTDNIEEAFDTASYAELAADTKVVAIGECGLDYFHSGTTEEQREVQKERFVAHIELALAVHKPLIIHCRDGKNGSDQKERVVEEASAHDDLQKILSSYAQEFQSKKVDVVIHFFTGTGELAQKYLALGCYLSFPGPITYTDMYDESIRVCPLERMLSETDSPFAAPMPHRGQRNEPVYVSEVVAKIATVKGLPVDEVVNQIILNSQRIFGI